MKTFICSLLLFAALCSFVFINSACVISDMEELYTLANALPEKAEDIDEKALETMEKLRYVWREKTDGFVMVLSYDLLDKADEAVTSLYCAVKCGKEDDIICAKEKFKDALERLYILCGAGFKSIF